MPKWYGGSALNLDQIIAPDQQWRVHLARLQRWFDRAKKIKEKSKLESLTN